jgi:hypothetical protein
MDECDSTAKEQTKPRTIDKLGEHISGKPRLFVVDNHSIGGVRERACPKHVRQLLWNELRRKH